MFRHTHSASALLLTALLVTLAAANAVYVPEPPAPVAPEQGQKLLPGPLRLQVRSGMRSGNTIYHFRVFAGDGNAIVAEGYSASAGWNVVVPRGELPLGVHRWTCRQYSNSTWSPWFSPEWLFEVEKPNNASFDYPPVPVSPPPGTKGLNLMPTLEVDGSTRAMDYHFRVFREDGNEVVAEGFTTEPSWTVTVPASALPPAIYSWSCRTRTWAEWSDWFEPRWYFEVEKPASPNQDGIQSGRTNSVADAMPLVYPNPCGRNGADIQLSLPRRSGVTLAIYSAEGELVRTLLRNQIVNPGTLQVSWDGKDNAGHSVAAGTYLCRVNTDDAHRVVKVTKSR